MNREPEWIAQGGGMNDKTGPEGWFTVEECRLLGYPEGTVYLLEDGEQAAPCETDTHSVNDPITNRYSWGTLADCERWLMQLGAERAKGSEE